MFETRTNRWDFPLGPVFGKAGTTTTIVIIPQCRVRIDGVMMTDTGGGTATLVQQFTVGNKVQRPTLQGATLAQFFDPLSTHKVGGVVRGVDIGGGDLIRWDTCQNGQAIALTIQFVVDATFFGALFGREVPF